jgi:hypothetical protein
MSIVLPQNPSFCLLFFLTKYHIIYCNMVYLPYACASSNQPEVCPLFPPLLSLIVLCLLANRPNSTVDAVAAVSGFCSLPPVAVYSLLDISTSLYNFIRRRSNLSLKIRCSSVISTITSRRHLSRLQPLHRLNIALVECD